MTIDRCVAVLCLAGFCTAATAHEGVVLFSSSWLDGVDKRIQFQRPEVKSIEIVDLQRGGIDKAVKVTINKDEDYSRVANGAPRAEISFNGFLHFQQKKEYSVSWETYIPDNYIFDTKQPELMAQIHQGPAAGYPPFALFFSEKGKYEIHNRTQSTVDSVNSFFGNLADDRGRVVSWELRYIPDATGESAVTELKKDGKLVYATKGVANSYFNDDGAYLKLGLYKADWKKKPSDVETRTIYYGRVSVTVVN